MSCCITPQEVENILPKGTDLTDAQIDAAIISASCLMERLKNGCGCGLSPTCLAQIGVYLAAHFAAVSDYTLSTQSEKDGCCDVMATYGFKFGEGILGTPFGQMANTLSGGCLEQLDKQPVGLFAIGAH